MHLIGSNPNDGAMLLEQSVNGRALLEAQDVRREPKFGDSGIPRARNVTERRKEELIYSINQEVNQKEQHTRRYGEKYGI